MTDMSIHLPASTPVWHPEHGYGLVNRFQSGIVYLDSGVDPRETSGSTGWFILSDARPRTGTALAVRHQWAVSPAQRIIDIREMLRIGRSKGNALLFDEVWMSSRKRPSTTHERLNRRPGRD